MTPIVIHYAEMSSRLPRRDGPTTGAGEVFALDGPEDEVTVARTRPVACATAGPVVEKAGRVVLEIMAGPHCPAMMNSRLTNRRRLAQVGKAMPRSEVSAWMPGSVLPSSHSRNAPPAVDT